MRVRYLAFAAIGVCRCVFAENCEPEWSAVGMGGADQTLPVVRAATVFQPLGAPSPVLIVGGSFSSIGGVPAQNFAAWDGHGYKALGDPPTGKVYALQAFDEGTGPALYAAGSFTFPGLPPTKANVVRWDGEAWSPAGDISGSSFTDLAVFDDGAGPALWVAADVSRINDQPVQSGVARWDGKQWAVNANGWVATGTYDLQVHDSGDGPSLYLGCNQGAFQLVGNEWQFVGNSVSNPIALASFDDGNGPALFAAWAYLSRWDGVSWVHLDMDFNWRARSFLAYDNQGSPALVAVGQFGAIGGVAASGVASWDGQTWHALGAGLSKAGGAGIGNGAVVFDDGRGPALFVVGEFDTAGGVPTPSVARWGCEAACPADCDTSGSLDLFDFLCFTNRFNAADPEADCDANGVFDLFDFLCFVNAFNKGC